MLQGHKFTTGRLAETFATSRIRLRSKDISVNEKEARIPGCGVEVRGKTAWCYA